MLVLVSKSICKEYVNFSKISFSQVNHTCYYKLNLQLLDMDTHLTFTLPFKEKNDNKNKTLIAEQ